VTLESALALSLLTALAALLVVHAFERRARRTDALLRRGMREAHRRGWLPEDLQ
jgi:thymidylate synthase ThyX